MVENSVFLTVFFVIIAIGFLVWGDYDHNRIEVHCNQMAADDDTVLSTVEYCLSSADYSLSISYVSALICFGMSTMVFVIGVVIKRPSS